MSVPPEEFSRIAGRVNLPLLGSRLVVVVGIGTVGSQIAKELAHSGVGRLRLIDGDVLEAPNLVRHVLTQRYVGMNKAEALVEHLSDEIPTLQPEALPRDVDDELSDDDLDALLEDADLIVAATDDRAAQRRLGRRALALDIPAVFPALYRDGGGEVVVQLSPEFPCFLCWDGFRSGDERLRGVTALNLDTLDIVQLGSQLCLGLLDRSSPYAALLRPEAGGRPPQLFMRTDFALAVHAIQRRPNCPSCRVGPAPSRAGGGTRSDSEFPFVPLARAATRAVRRWWIVLAAAMILPFFAALGAARSFEIYGKTSYRYGEALGYLLQISIATAVAALAGLWAAELLAHRAGDEGRYRFDWDNRGPYEYLLLGAAVAPATIFFFTHGHEATTPPPWWWLVAPISVCLAHVGFLTVDRWSREEAPEVSWIPVLALSAFLMSGIVIGFPSFSPPVPSAPVTTTPPPAPRPETQPEEEPEVESPLPSELEEMEPCLEAETSEGASEAFLCEPEGATVTVEYFDTAEEVTERIVEEAEATGVTARAGTCPFAAPVLQRFFYYEDEALVPAYVLCDYGSGEATYAWTEPSVRSFSLASISAEDLLTGQEWWEEQWEPTEYTPAEERSFPEKWHPQGFSPCEPAETFTSAVWVLMCTPGDPLIRAEYFRTPDEARARLQEQVELAGAQGGRCPEDAPAVQHFLYEGEDDKTFVGRVLCFIQNGRAIYDWTNPAERRYNEAVFSGPDLKAADRWWGG